MREIEGFLTTWFYIELAAGTFILGFLAFIGWCFYVYVTSRRDWFEEDVRIRNAEKSYNLARAEQVRLESLALKDRLEKGGINTGNYFD
ncbi:hypothetical protein [Halomonas koreensis]|uniref:Uncharacterized protein n=1 Tax=Halomonas koreensis TaxID=245385 RepID=A0ABU1FYD1_9GAMM|nr:hypothetical protein [Halomonas koreensis]MDR5865283.1 hypothetical protein [Halomonas koreensis]